MSYVVINAITVPSGQGDELAARFAGRAGMVEQADGFEQFDLLRPADDRDRWLVVTRWRDEASFEAWMASSAFGQAHAPDRPAAGEGTGGHPGGGHPGGHPGGAPVASASEVWAFSVEQHLGAPG